MKIKQFRKKPVAIEAVMLTSDATHNKEVAEWCGGKQVGPTIIEIPTLEGTMRAGISDYIIKGVKGEFYPCKLDIFQQTYEEIK